MSSLLKTLQIIFDCDLNISKYLEDSSKNLDEDVFNNFFDETYSVLSLRFRKRTRRTFQLKVKFDAEIKPFLKTYQSEKLEQLIRKFNVKEEGDIGELKSYQELIETIRRLKMDDSHFIGSTNVALYKLVYPQWIPFIGPRRKIIPGKEFQEIFNYDTLSNFKKREYCSYSAILCETISKFLKNCEFFKQYAAKFSLDQNVINFNIESYKLPHYKIECPKNIEIVSNLKNFVAEVKFDGDRLLVARSECCANLNNNKYFTSDKVPCHWKFLNINDELFKRNYEYYPLESWLDNLCFPMICASKSFKYDHEYEKNVQNNLNENVILLESLLLQKKNDAILTDFVFNINVDYSKEMIDLEKDLIAQYFEYLFPNLHNRAIHTGEMLSFQGDIEGVFELFPSQMCRRNIKTEFSENSCKIPCVVLECTYAYCDNPYYDFASIDKQKDMLLQIKESITDVREKDRFVTNVLVVQDVYSINNYRLSHIPRLHRMELLDKMIRNPKRDRISPSYRRCLKNKKELKEFMIESKKFASSGIILRHKEDESKIYSLKTKCCIDLILLGVKLLKGNLSSIYLGVVTHETDYIWLEKIGADASEFDSRILCATQSIPDFLNNDLYTLFELDYFSTEPDGRICHYKKNDQPTHYLKKQYRFVVEIEGKLKIFDNTASTKKLRNRPNGMIITDILVKRKRNDRIENTANNLVDLMKVFESIKYIN